jgi:NAD(P)-dependent dehydrogenase (short-subunit alcohol dehydrogenase family)
VIRADATYLITGGLGGLGLELARWLAGHGARHLLLTGRTPLPAAPEDGGVAPGLAALRDLERRGASVTYRSADVADEAAMRAVLRAHEQAGRPPVRGVFHAAGRLSFQAVADLSPAELTGLLRPKLAGGLVLHRLFATADLDYFVLFSSASAVLASPQLAAYSAANAALDAVARQRRAAGRTALSANWGYWSEAGMIARYAAEHGRFLAPRGLASFTPAQGLAVLQRLLPTALTGVTVLAADWAAWTAAYPQAARDPLLRDLVPPAPVAEPVPAAAPPPAPAPATASASDDQAGTGETGTGRAEVEVFLTGVVTRVLKLPPHRLNARNQLIREGMDSLMATEVRREVQRAFGVNISVTRMLHGLSLAELTDSITGELAARPARA